MATSSFSPMSFIVKSMDQKLEGASIEELIEKINDLKQNLGISSHIESTHFQVGGMEYKMNFAPDGKAVYWKKHQTAQEWSQVGSIEPTKIERAMQKIYVLAFLVNVFESGRNPLVSQTRRQTIVSTAGDAVDGVFPLTSMSVPSSPVSPTVPPSPVSPTLDDFPDLRVSETIEEPVKTFFAFMIEFFVGLFIFYFGGFFEEPTVPVEEPKVPIEEPKVPFVEVAKRAPSTRASFLEILLKPRKKKLALSTLATWSERVLANEKQVTKKAIEAIDFFIKFDNLFFVQENIGLAMTALGDLRKFYATFQTKKSLTDGDFTVVGPDGRTVKISSFTLDKFHAMRNETDMVEDKVNVSADEFALLIQITPEKLMEYDDIVRDFIVKVYEKPVDEYDEVVITPTGRTFIHESVNDDVWKTVMSDW